MFWHQHGNFTITSLQWIFFFSLSVLLISYFNMQITFNLIFLHSNHMFKHFLTVIAKNLITW